VNLKLNNKIELKKKGNRIKALSKSRTINLKINNWQQAIINKHKIKGYSRNTFTKEKESREASLCLNQKGQNAAHKKSTTDKERTLTLSSVV
jgi:hypothetical protein